MEMLDVVNEYDQVVDQASKDECHKKALLHRSVFVFLFDSTKRLVLQKRSSKKLIRPHKLTASACGHVLTGESYAQAAERELKEELGVQAELKEILKTIGPYERDRELITLYEGHSNGVLKPNASEIAQIIPLSIETILQEMERGVLDFGDTFKKVFCEYVALQNQRPS